MKIDSSLKVISKILTLLNKLCVMNCFFVCDTYVLPYSYLENNTVLGTNTVLSVNSNQIFFLPIVLEVTRSKAKFSVFRRTSKSGDANTLKMSITSSCRTFSCDGTSFKAIILSNTISFTLLSLSFIIKSM